MEHVPSVLIILGLLAAYFLPCAVAIQRKHHQTAAIAALNILLGWTFLGWVAALVWALTMVRTPPVAEKAAVSKAALPKPRSRVPSGPVHSWSMRDKPQR